MEVCSGSRLALRRASPLISGQGCALSDFYPGFSPLRSCPDLVRDRLATPKSRGLVLDTPHTVHRLSQMLGYVELVVHDLLAGVGQIVPHGGFARARMSIAKPGSHVRDRGSAALRPRAPFDTGTSPGAANSGLAYGRAAAIPGRFPGSVSLRC